MCLGVCMSVYMKTKTLWMNYMIHNDKWSQTFTKTSKIDLYFLS